MAWIIYDLQNLINIKLVWYILLFPIVLFWVRTILYTVKDISHRTSSFIYQVFSILVVALLWPCIWFPLYLIFRPIRLLDDIARRKSIESLSIECLWCWELNYKDNSFCINCWEKLFTECKECKKHYYKWYGYCPYCGAPNLEVK